MPWKTRIAFPPSKWGEDMECEGHVNRAAGRRQWFFQQTTTAGVEDGQADQPGVPPPMLELSASAVEVLISGELHEDYSGDMFYCRKP